MQGVRSPKTREKCGFVVGSRGHSTIERRFSVTDSASILVNPRRFCRFRAVDLRAEHSFDNRGL
jgi:hypothetical protein